MTLSILHRGTGLAMAVGFLVLAAWLVSAAAGTVEYEEFTALIASPFGRLLLIGWTFAFFYHLANGVRHLVWDAGHGFEKHQANRSAWFVLGLSVLATAAFWVLL
jgi:succinate dehydrogenase / fumarate reductase cytochrome b subunit